MSDVQPISSMVETDFGPQGLESRSHHPSRRVVGDRPRWPESVHGSFGVGEEGVDLSRTVILEEGVCEISVWTNSESVVARRAPECIQREETPSEIYKLLS